MPITHDTPVFTKPQNLWLEALESGEYTQTNRCLNDENGFCCLGLACIVYEKETGNKLPRNKEGYIKGLTLTNVQGVQEWLGLISHSGVPLNDKFSSLTVMNDHKSKTFKEISTHVKTNPRQYLLQVQ